MASTRLLSHPGAVRAPQIRHAISRRNPAILVGSQRPLRVFSPAESHSVPRGVVSMSAAGRAEAVKETLGTEAYEKLAGKQVRKCFSDLPNAFQTCAAAYCACYCKPNRVCDACMLQVYLVSTQEPLDITSLWGQDERAVLVFGRSMGVSFHSQWHGCDGALPSDQCC